MAALIPTRPPTQDLQRRPSPVLPMGWGRESQRLGRRVPLRLAPLRSPRPAVCLAKFSRDLHHNRCLVTAPPHPPRFMGRPPTDQQVTMESTAQRAIPPLPTQPQPRIHCSHRALVIFNTTPYCRIQRMVTVPTACFRDHGFATHSWVREASQTCWASMTLTHQSYLPFQTFYF